MDVHLVLKSDPSSGNGTPVFQKSTEENKIIFPKFQTKFDFKSISYPNDNVFEKASYSLIKDKFFNKTDSLLLTLGPTNSGKSHLLFQNDNSIIEKSLHCIFENIDQLANDITPIKKFYPNIKNSCEMNNNFNNSVINSQLYLSISMFELYNDSINDLLNSNMIKNDRNNLNIVTDPIDHKLTPRNITKTLVNSYDSAHEIIFNSLKNRKTFPTFANNHSSRSHCFIVFDLYKIYGNVLESTRFTIVDLAGLERSKSARTSGISLREASYTNGSLTELGRCLELISMNQFHKTCLRTNKLTRLVLNDFVKSNNPVNILVTLDPFGEEGLILQTLRYIDPIKYQDLQRKSLLTIKSKQNQRVIGKVEQKHFIDEIDKLRSSQKALKLKIQSLENTLLENENKLRNELYKEHEKNVLQITLDYKKEIDELSNQAISVTDKKLQDQSDSFMVKINGLNKILTEREKELEESLLNLTKTNSQLEELKHQYSQLQALYDELKSNDSKTIEKISTQLEESLVRNESLKMEIEMLNLKYSDIKSNNDTALKQLEDEKSVIINLLKDDLNKSTGKVSQLNNDLLILQEKFQNKENSNEDLNNSIELLKESIRVGESKLQEKETIIKNMQELSKSMKDQNDEILKLKENEICKLESEINEVKARSDKEIGSLKYKLEERANEILLLKNDESAVQNLKEELLNKTNEYKTLYSQMEKLKKTHDEELKSIDESFNLKNDEILLLKKQNTDNEAIFKTQINSKNIEFVNLKAELEAKTSELENNSSKLSNLNVEVEKLKSNYDELLKSKDDIETKLKEEISAFKLLLDKQILKNKTLKYKIQEINDKKEIESETDSAEKKKLNDVLLDLETKLKRKDDEVESIIQSKKSVEEELARLQMVCSDLKDEVSDKAKFLEKYNSLKNKNILLKDQVTSLETNNVKIEEELQTSKTEIQMLKNRISAIEKRELESRKSHTNDSLSEALSQSLTSSQPVNRTPRKSLNLLNTDPLDDIGLPPILSSPIKSSSFNIHNDNVHEKDNTIDIGAAQRKKTKNKISKRDQILQQKENHENDMESKFETPKSNKKMYRALVNTKLSELNKKSSLSVSPKLDAKAKKRKSSSPLKPGKKKVRNSVANEDSLELLE
ncbi:hypothetical protein DAPK24_005250 [Pichia kluyveri]|uniref:Kinesin motor domain-containing protein n=1 Tax=Pichia kluyveri TaxID=36015 RepID=A0AAV5QY41_PICKL|nr:hypothetical protein DAPK24_005250 [Pichia kluyveri]